MTLNISAKNKCFSSIAICVFLAAVSFRAHSYVKFNSVPTEGWGAIFEKSGVKRYYEVQTLDNLHDISKTLFGDSSFWPKIWSINSGITNPHIIEKGNFIYFSGGSHLEPPRFGIEKVVPVSYTYGTGFLKPELPPERLRQKAIKIPVAFQNYFTNAGQKEVEQDHLNSVSSELSLVRSTKRKVLITSELSSKRPSSIGEVLRINSGGSVARAGSMVLIKFDKSSSPEIGNNFTAFSYEQKSFVAKGHKSKVGLIQWLGSLTITSELKKGYYYAEVTECNELLPIGAKLSIKPIVSIDLPNHVTGEVSSLKKKKIKIIGAHKSANALIIGEYDIVYIKGGEKKGLVENEIYPIFDNFGVGTLDKYQSYKPKSIGYVKIAKVSKKFSTGVVFNLSDTVTNGSVLGQMDQNPLNM